MRAYFNRKYKTIAFISALLLITTTMLYYRQVEMHEKAEAKLNNERRETAHRIREGAKLLADRTRKNPNYASYKKDPFAPKDMTDADELAQIKLWNKMSPEQRKKYWEATK